MSGADRPLRVSVDRIGAQADGLGRLADGTPCIIPGGLPGEVLEALAGFTSAPVALLQRNPPLNRRQVDLALRGGAGGG